MDTLETLHARRNVRTYTDQPISEEDLRAILEVGRRSPSSKNMQRWEFVVVTDRKQLESLSQVWRGSHMVADSAATIALIAPVAEDPHIINSINFDLGQAAMAMMTAAAALGIGSCQTWVENQDLAREVLGHPKDRMCAWLIALGYPADRPLKPVKRPKRREFEDVVHMGGW
ncbi:MAG: nitroreductase family protein [Acidimicrobiia bacterium]|nr:nitroreductase family protein [Acidimicrobiia bacterium]